MTSSTPRIPSLLNRSFWTLLLALIVAWTCFRVSSGQIQSEADEQLNQYLFNGSSQDAFGQSQKEKGQARMKLLDRLLTLNERQKEKLELAIELDIAGYLQDVVSVREKVQGLSPNNNNEWQKFWKHVSPLYQRVQAGLFDEESLYQKVSKSVLDDDQLAKLLEQEEANQKLLVERAAYRAVTHLSSQMPILVEQQQQLVDLMIANAEGKQLNAANRSQEQYMQWALIGSLPIEKLPASLDKSQVSFLRAYRDRYKSYDRFLK